MSAADKLREWLPFLGGSSKDAKFDSAGRKISLKYYRDGWDRFLKRWTVVFNILGGGGMIGFFALAVFMMSKLLEDKTKWIGGVVELAFAAVAVGILSGCGIVCAEISAERQLHKIRQEFMLSILRQDISFFDEQDANTLATRLIFNTRVVRDLLGYRSSVYWTYLSQGVGFVVWAFFAHWKISLVTVSTFPVIVVAGWWASRIEYAAGVRVAAKNELADSLAQETFASIKTVKANNLQPVLANRYCDYAEDVRKTAVMAGLKTGLGFGIYWFCIFASIGFGYYYGAVFLHSVMKGETEINDTNDVDFGHIIGAFLANVAGAYFFGKILNWGSARATALRAIRETVALCDRKTKIDSFDESGILVGDDLKGEIVFQKVVFAYPTRMHIPVFGSLDLRIPAGKSVALVGSSGCGKSTVIQLLMRFYDPQEGTIKLDGVNLQSYRVRSLRQAIGWVGQEPKLFATSIANNIAIGRAGTFDGGTGNEADPTNGGNPENPEDSLYGVKMSEIIEAAKQSNAHEFIMSLPDGYNTNVGEGGGQMSGGQKQRVAIARALIKNPKILILDEATSALDNQSEQLVQATIDNIVAQRAVTTIVIAHRLTTVRGCDLIAVLRPNTPNGPPLDGTSGSQEHPEEEGDEPDDVGAPSVGASVVELGTHENLIKIKNGIYAALVAMQTTGNEGFDTLPSIASVDDEQSAAFRMESRQMSRALAAGVSRGTGEPAVAIGRGNSKYLNDPLIGRMASLVLDESYRPPRLFRRTLDKLSREWISSLLGGVCAVAFQLMWPIFGYCFADFVGSYVDIDAMQDKDTYLHKALLHALDMWYIGVGIFVSFWGQRYLVGRGSQKIVKMSRREVFESLVGQEPAFFDQEHRAPGRVAFILAGQCTLLGDWICMNTTTWIGTVAAGLTGVIMCFRGDWALGLVALAIIALLIPLVWANSVMATTGGNFKIFDKSGKPDKLVETTERMATVVADAVQNVRVVTSYNTQSRYLIEYEGLVERAYRLGWRRAWIAGLFTAVITAARLGCIVGIIACAAWRCNRKEASRATTVKIIRGAIGFLAASFQIGRSLAANVPNALGRSSARSVWDVCDRRPMIEEDKTCDGIHVKAVTALTQVAFVNVAFKYPSRPNQPIYRDVSFEIKKGQSVALVGASGCGKSTAVQLIERFYDVFDPANTRRSFVSVRASGPGYGDGRLGGVGGLGGLDEQGGIADATQLSGFGRVLVNGVDIRDVQLTQLRSRIGLVSQEPLLFSGTVRENLLLGNPNATEAEVMSACETANAWEFIAKLEKGLDTEVGRGGSLLSGGQKQRVAIARALIRRPDLLILDEATSALDAASEKIVQAAINQLLADSSREFCALIIAHRLSTIRTCDKIIVFTVEPNRGSRIAEVGSHSELMRIQGGIYKNLIRIAQTQ